MLIIHEFCICKFVYLLKFICNPQINICETFVVSLDTHMSRVAKNLSCLIAMFSVEVERGKNSLPFCFSSYTINKCPFCHLFGTMFPSFLCFLLVILLFKLASKHSAEVLSSVTRSKKAVMCLTEKICMLGSFVEAWVIVLLAVNSTLMNQQHVLNKGSLNRDLPKTTLCTDQLTNLFWPEVHSNLTLYFPSCNGSEFTISVLVATS